MQARDEVDGVGDDQAHYERVAGCSDDVGELHVELAVVVVDPAAGYYACVNAVQADDVRCAEEGVGHEA